MRTEFARDDIIQLAVTVSDGTDSAVSNIVTVTIDNALPVITGVALSPTAPTTDTDLIATPSFADADGDTSITFAYQWRSNGQVLGAYTTQTLPSTAFQSGDLIDVVVVPHDGFDAGAPYTSTAIRVANTPPQIAGVSIDPDPVLTNDDATAVPIAWFDADGDTPTYDYAWTVNGFSVSGNVATLISDQFDKGDTVQATVTPRDPSSSGTPKTATFLVANTPPAASGFALTPSNPTTQDDIQASVATMADADSDPMELSCSWSVQGNPIGGSNCTLSSGLFVRGDLVEVTASVSDGTDAVTFTGNKTIGNARPRVNSLSITPTQATSSDTLTAVSSWFDADNDPVTLTYAWTANGAPLAGTTDTLSPSSFVRGQAIAVTATPHDLIEAGVPMTSVAVTIDNSPPSIAGVTLSPAAPRTTDALTATPSGWTDQDGDSPDHLYQWRVDNQLVTGQVGATLDESHFAKGDVVKVTAQPHDGFEPGATVTASVTIGNSPPEAGSLTLTPNPPTSQQALTAGLVGYSDPDAADTLTVSCAWLVNGQSAGTPSCTLDPSAFSRGQIVDVQVTVGDGTDSDSRTAQVTAANAPPVASQVYITPGDAHTDDALAANVVASDADNDAISHTYQWRANEGLVGSNSPSLSPLSFSKGDEITVTATPFDGFESGLAVESAIVTIQNSVPSIDSVDLVPGAPTTSTHLTATLNNYQDADPSDPHSPQIRWSVNNQAVVGESSPTLTSPNFKRNDMVTVSVTPYDEEDQGMKVTDQVTIGNAIPVVTASIRPIGATSSDALFINTDTWNDADLDDGLADIQSLTVTWFWQIAGVDYDLTGPVLAGPIPRGTWVHAEVVPYDGIDSGSTFTTGAIQIGNTRPTGADVSISPTDPTSWDSLTAVLAGNGSDVDGDPVSFHFRWYADNELIVGASLQTLPPANVVRDAQITVEAIPFDDIDEGLGRFSDPVTVDNGLPSTPTVFLPASPASRDDLQCTITTHSVDPDGDAISYEFVWTRTGVAFTDDLATTVYPGDTVPSSATLANQVFECQVTPSDIYGSGDTATANATIAAPYIVKTTVGDEHTCMLDSDGAVYCIGYDAGQSVRLIPPVGVLFDDIHTNASLNCGVTQGGAEVQCWGNGDSDIEDPDDWPQLSDIPGATRFLTVEFGTEHGCVLTDHPTDNVHCYGNDYTTNKVTGAPSGRYDVLTVGSNTSCAIAEAPSRLPFCWGNDYSSNNLVDDTPVNEPLLDISLEHDHACAVRFNGTPYCWGNTGNYDKGEPPDPFAIYTEIEAGRFFTCAKKPDNTLECWGHASTHEYTTPPDGEFDQFDSAKEHSCAVTLGGASVECWGRNNRGEAPELWYPPAAP